MDILQKIGLAILIAAIGLFVLSLGLNSYQLQEESLYTESDFHKAEILKAAESQGIMNKTYGSNIAFINALKGLFKEAQTNLEVQAEAGIPDGVSEWDYKLGDWKIKDYVFENTKASGVGFVSKNTNTLLYTIFGLGIFGAFLYIIPLFRKLPGIKNDGIYHSSMTRGLTLTWRTFFLITTTIGLLLYGVMYMGSKVFWPLVTLAVIGLIVYLVYFREKQRDKIPPKSASPNVTAWFGVITGILLIGFYILLYWKPEYITNWIALVDPVSRKLSGNPASNWFLYGFLYTIIVIVMGIRMIAKYRHNKYQIFRTFSVMFFQTAFAFLIPEILVRLNQPWYDFKNIWPLNYNFFFDYNLDTLTSSGSMGLFMLFWGILLILVGVPVITYFFGKRWYCSWVCGCGGLAETMGDPYRQLSDKSLRAWKYERYIIHGVLVFAVIMTLLVLYSYFTGNKNVLFMNSDTVRTWYGFLIGSAFAGVVGTGFYPLMGNRTWCRFGCPLAAYLGLVQKFKSRFRITTNGGQCISCGNCSTYCEMGIDVRWYAQRGQDIVRSSCVGCGVCSAVCPRGVLRLENGTVDLDTRAEETRVIHISEDEVSLIQ